MVHGEAVQVSNASERDCPLSQGNQFTQFEVTAAESATGPLRSTGTPS